MRNCIAVEPIFHNVDNNFMLHYFLSILNNGYNHNTFNYTKNSIKSYNRVGKYAGFVGITQ